MVNQEHFHKIRALIETVKHHNVTTPPCLSATVMFLLWNAVCFTPDITKLKVPLLTHLPSIARFSDIIRSSRHFFPDQIHISSAIQRLFEVLWEKSSGILLSRRGCWSLSQWSLGRRRCPWHCVKISCLMDWRKCSRMTWKKSLYIKFH